MTLSGQCLSGLKKINLGGQRGGKSWAGRSGLAYWGLHWVSSETQLCSLGRKAGTAEGCYLASASFPFISYGPTAPLQFIVWELCCHEQRAAPIDNTVPPWLELCTCVAAGGNPANFIRTWPEQKKRGSVLKLVRQRSICKLHKYKRTLCICSVDSTVIYAGGKNKQKKNNLWRHWRIKTES